MIRWIKNYFLSTVVGLILFLLASPYFVWDIFTLYISVLLVPILVFNIDIQLGKKKCISLIILIILLLIFVYLSTLNAYLIFVVFVLIYLLKEKKKIEFLNGFKLVYSVFIFISLIFYILIVFCGLSVDYILLQPVNQLKDYGYFKYPFLIVPNLLDTNMFRFHGLFDEPGVVGSISGILLVGDKYRLNKWTNWICFLSGIFSLSFFFILLSLLFWMSKINYKNLAIIFALILAFYFLTYENELINRTIYQRLIVEDGQLAGNNRFSEYFNEKFVTFLNTPAVWFGKGKGAAYALGDGSFGYKHFIYDWGIILFSLFFLFYFVNVFFFLKNKSNIYAFVILFLGMIYQRPYLTQPLYFFLFVSIITNLSASERKLSDVCLLNNNMK